MRKKEYVINLVQGEYFNNLSVSSQKVQQILFMQFDLIQWYLANTKHDKSHIEIKNYVNKKIVNYQNQTISIFHITNPKNQLSENVKQKSAQKQIRDRRIHQNQLLIIAKKDNLQVETQKKKINDKKHEQSIENLYRIQYYFHNINSSLFQQENYTQKYLHQLVSNSKNTLIGRIIVRFRCKINQNKCSSQQNQQKQSIIKERSYIQIMINQQQYNSFSEQHSLLQHISIVLNKQNNSNTPYHPVIPMQLDKTQSYLTFHSSNYLLQQSHNSSYQPNQIKKVRKKFIFRNFHRMATKQQILSLSTQYANQVQRQCKCKQQDQQQQQQQYVHGHNQNQHDLHFKQDLIRNYQYTIPDNHFICHASNSFIPFILSFTNLLPLQTQILFIQQYISILNPSYNNSSQTLNKNHQPEFTLQKQTYQSIKKTLNFLINKLILQYSNQISQLGSEISFIFQIIQLLNDTVVNQNLIKMILKLLGLYGGYYPNVLLEAKEWLGELEMGKGGQIKREQRIKYNQNKQKQQDVKLSLNKIISPGFLTRHKPKVIKRIQKLFTQLKIDKNKFNNKKITFKQHFMLSKNAITIAAFDITSHKMRFLNYLTVPDMDMIQLLVHRQKYQCIKIEQQWLPYRIVYDNQTFLVNLKDHQLISPIGIQYLQQYLDNQQAKKRYFYFQLTHNNKKSHNHNHNNKQPHHHHHSYWQKYIFSGKDMPQQIYQNRLKQFRQKRKLLITQIKKQIINNIPKTKLIWRFLKQNNNNNKGDKNDNNRKSSGNNSIQSNNNSIGKVLKKIQIVNYLYNILKTLKNQDKNINRQIWLQSKMNGIVDEVRKDRKDFVQQGKELERVNWEIQRLEQMKRVFLLLSKESNSNKRRQQKEQRFQLKGISQSLRYNIIGNIQRIYSGNMNVLSINQVHKLISEVYRGLKKYNQMIKFYTTTNQQIRLNKQSKQCLKQIQNILTKTIKSVQFLYINKYYLKNYLDVFQIEENLPQIKLLNQADRAIEQIETVQNKHKHQQQQLINQIQKYQQKTITNTIDNILNSYKSYQNYLIKQNNKTKNQSKQIKLKSINQTYDNKQIKSWFQIQQQYNRFVKQLYLGIQKSIFLPSFNIKLQLFHQFGIKEFQIYDKYLQHLEQLQQKTYQQINVYQQIKHFHHNYHNTNNSNNRNKIKKIDLVIDGMQNSEIQTELNLKILFKQLEQSNSSMRRKLGQRDELTHNQNKGKQQFKQSIDWLFSKKQQNNSQHNNIKLQKHFLSFTCTSFDSIVILHLILQNNFKQKKIKTNNINNNNKNQSKPQSQPQLSQQQQTYNSIISTLPTLKTLLSWTDQSQINQIFDNFNWHIEQNQHIKQFYQNIYNQKFYKELQKSYHIQKSLVQNVQAQLSQKIIIKSKQNKCVKNTKFYEERKCVYKFITYQILQEWVQAIKNNHNKEDEYQLSGGAYVMA